MTPHTVTIYRWDSTQSAFVDTGEVPDTATGETFASSETLQQVAIDDSHLVNPVNTADPTKPVLAKAEDVIQTKLKSVFAQCTVNKNNGTTLAGYRVKSSGQLEYQGSNFASTKINCAGYDYAVIFGGVYKKGDTVSVGFGFFDEEPTSSSTPIDKKSYDIYGAEKSYKAYVLNLPKQATWIAANIKSSLFSGLEGNFYCYLLKGVLETNNEETATLIGNNDEWVFSDFYPVLAGHKYKIYIKYPDIAISNVSFSSSYIRTAAYFVPESRILDTSNNYIFRYYEAEGTTLESEYDYSAEDNGYVVFSMRANAGEKQVFKLVDVTYTDTQSQALNAAIQEINQRFILVSDYVTETVLQTYPGQVFDGHNAPGGFRNISAATALRYGIEQGKTYYLNGVFTGTYASTEISVVSYAKLVNGSYVYISSQFYSTSTPFVRRKLTPPSDAEFIFVTTQTINTSSFSVESTMQEDIDLEELAKSVEALEEISEKPTDKLMKVVVNNTEGRAINNAFYIRTKYNDSKDIILQQRINSNGVLGFYATYIGSNELNDVQLMTPTNQVVDCSDSTAPFFGSNNYWAIFAQHGYPIPYFSKPNGMTSDSEGSVWRDQIGRTYTIGKVGESYVYLLPIFHYDSDGHYIRDWSFNGHTTDITSLEYVSGTSTFQDTISVATSQSQRYSIMEASNRHFIADGREITEAGTYYCDDFKVSEEQVGYDPATVQDWFGVTQEGSSTLLADLTGAEPMVIFTWSYNWKGCHCAMNTTVKLLKEIDCFSYGALQQQFFVDSGEYDAYMMIPKAKAHNGVTLNEPFHSTTGSAGHEQYRSSTYLIDVDDPCDRQVGFLLNPNTGDYKIGLAAGLSLISGDTVTTKRVAGMKLGHTSGDRHDRVSSIDPDQKNKFYVAAINTSLYEDRQFYLPIGYFKEINCYVSYFDPAENQGQVYWYKEGNRYVIYCHCQSEATNLAIKLPEFMEGLNLSVVEKTNGTTLLSDVVTNGKFYVSYDNTANYIVLIA